jgi:hypothetical protein
MSRLESITRDEIVYSGCACECFVKITGHDYGEGDYIIGVDYCQTMANDYGLRSTWRSRLKRAWAALRNKDWNPGFEFYDEETAVEFAEKYGEVLWHTFPAKPIEESDAN